MSSPLCVIVNGLEGSWLSEPLERATFAFEGFLPFQCESFPCFLGFLLTILAVQWPFKIMFSKNGVSNITVAINTFP